jgi:5-(carboxyamino)imidazole ribonucleotide mutase
MKEKIVIVLGSKSDLKDLKAGFDLLDESAIAYRREIISAHRNPERLRSLCLRLEKDGTRVVIACAGCAAALPGFVASYVNIPVIGVALKGGLLDGLDALFSIVSNPKGLGLASTGVGRSAFINAIILSLEILTLENKKYKTSLLRVKNKFR